jgi:hypothetical protein
MQPEVAERDLDHLCDCLRCEAAVVGVLRDPVTEVRALKRAAGDVREGHGPGDATPVEDRERLLLAALDPLTLALDRVEPLVPVRLERSEELAVRQEECGQLARVLRGEPANRRHVPQRATTRLVSKAAGTPLR